MPTDRLKSIPGAVVRSSPPRRQKIFFPPPVQGNSRELYLDPQPDSKGLAVQQNPLVAALLSKSQLCERLSVSERTIENMVKSGTFPPPVRVGKFVYWSEVAVRKWQERLFAVQESWTVH